MFIKVFRCFSSDVFIFPVSSRSIISQTLARFSFIREQHVGSIESSIYLLIFHTTYKRRATCDTFTRPSNVNVISRPRRVMSAERSHGTRAVP